MDCGKGKIHVSDHHCPEHKAHFEIMCATWGCPQKKVTPLHEYCKEHTCTGTKEKSHQESVQVILAKLVYVRS